MSHSRSRAIKTLEKSWRGKYLLYNEKLLIGFSPSLITLNLQGVFSEYVELKVIHYFYLGRRQSFPKPTGITVSSQCVLGKAGHCLHQALCPQPTHRNFPSPRGSLAPAAPCAWQTLPRKEPTEGSHKSSLQSMGPAPCTPPIYRPSPLNSQVGQDSYIPFLHRQLVHQEAMRKLLGDHRSLPSAPSAPGCSGQC